MADGNDLVLERMLDAPARSGLEGLDRRPSISSTGGRRGPIRRPRCEMDLRPGGIFYTRMTGPDGFDIGQGTGCFLEVVEGEKFVWTSALGPDYRPNELGPRAAARFPFTAIMTFEDAGDGKTRYRAVAMHRNAADRDTHAKMGFHDGWGTCADQLENCAGSPRSSLTPRSGRYRSSLSYAPPAPWMRSINSAPPHVLPRSEIRHPDQGPIRGYAAAPRARTAHLGPW